MAKTQGNGRLRGNGRGRGGEQGYYLLVIGLIGGSSVEFSMTYHSEHLCVYLCGVFVLCCDRGGFGGVFLSFCLEGINGNRGGDTRGNRGQRTTDNVCRHNGAMEASRGGVGRYLDTKNGMTS